MKSRRDPSEVIKFIKRGNIRFVFEKDHFNTRSGQKRGQKLGDRLYLGIEVEEIMKNDFRAAFTWELLDRL